MARHRPWYKRRGGDFVMAVLHFPDNDHRYAYSAILDMLNDRDRPLSDDAGFICGFTGLTRKKWSIVRAWLVRSGYLILLDDGRLTNAVFEEERKERREARDEAEENGRIGGKKSAALRQGRLPLQEDQPKKRVDSTPESTPDSTPKGGETPTGQPLKNHEKVEPPPQPTRARKSPDKNLLSNNHIESQVDAREKSDDRLPDDFISLWELTCAAAGHCPTNTGAITRSQDQVKAWQQAGIDFREVVIPTVQTIMHESTEPTNSLARFDKQIRHEHAKRTARALNGSAPTKPLPEPILEFPDEPEIAKAIRADMLAALGKHGYAAQAHSIRLEVADGAGPHEQILYVHPRTRFFAFWDGLNPQMMRHLAQKHGLSDAWKGR